MTAGRRDGGTAGRAPVGRLVSISVLAGALLVAGAAPATAQIADHFAGGAGVASTRLRVVSPAQSGTLSGLSAIGTARAILGRFALIGSYRQGSLKPDSGGGVTQSLVEGRLLLAIRPIPWLEVAGGPIVRSYVTPGSTENLVLMTARLRGEGSIITDVVRTHVQLWEAVSATTNVTGATGAARGGEAGITVKVPRSPVWTRLVYSIDRSELKGTGRVETLEDLTLTIGFGRPY